MDTDTGEHGYGKLCVAVHSLEPVEGESERITTLCISVVLRALCVVKNVFVHRGHREREMHRELLLFPIRVPPYPCPNF